MGRKLWVAPPKPLSRYDSSSPNRFANMNHYSKANQTEATLHPVTQILVALWNKTFWEKYEKLCMSKGKQQKQTKYYKESAQRLLLRSRSHWIFTFSAQELPEQMGNNGNCNHKRFTEHHAIEIWKNSNPSPEYSYLNKNPFEFNWAVCKYA